MIRTYAKIMGFVLLLVGIMGFVPALTPNNMLFGLFMVDMVHNMVHILSGAIFVMAGYSRNEFTARRATLGLAIVYGLVTLLGFIMPDGNILGLFHVNMADNILHLAITASALVVALPQPYRTSY